MSAPTSIQNLQQLLPRSQRALNGIPVYYVQVPKSLVDVMRPNAPAPPLWPESSVPDSDQRRTWCLLYTNDVTVYIRDNEPPNDPEGLWAVAPNREEIFIPKSLSRYQIICLNPTSPVLPPPSPTPGPDNVPTLISRHATTVFMGRQCKICAGQHNHFPSCASIQPGYSCEWCRQTNGAHELACPGFASEH